MTNKTHFKLVKLNAGEFITDMRILNVGDIIISGTSKRIIDRPSFGVVFNNNNSTIEAPSIISFDFREQFIELLADSKTNEILFLSDLIETKKTSFFDFLNKNENALTKTNIKKRLDNIDNHYQRFFDMAEY